MDGTMCIHFNNFLPYICSSTAKNEMTYVHIDCVYYLGIHLLHTVTTVSVQDKYNTHLPSQHQVSVRQKHN
jgi:hypothetical protein